MKTGDVVKAVKLVEIWKSELLAAWEAMHGEVEVSPSGEGLHWESLNVDLSVPGVLQRVFGTTSWMRQLASHGGRSRSPAKVRAARSNGAKGGRPRRSGKGRRRNRVAA